MNTVASASERNNAVVQGQEDLEGVKEIKIKKVLKKNSDSEYVVTQSTRTEMVYDTDSAAKAAYKDIHDAKEEAVFDSNTDDEASDSTVDSEKTSEDDSDVSASYTFGMSILANLTEEEILQMKAAVPGATDVTDEKTQEPLNMDVPQTQRSVEKFVGPAGYATMVELSSGANSQVGKDPKTAEQHNSLLVPDFEVSNTEHELTLGVNREMEHVDRPDQALEIAIDHLAENPNYYTLLNKVMPEGGVEQKPERQLFIDEQPSAHELADKHDYNKSYDDYIKGLLHNDK